MEPTAYISHTRSSESSAMIDQSSTRKASDFDAFSAMCAKYRQEGWDEARGYYEAKIEQKDEEIKKLKAQLAMLQSSQPSSVLKNYEANTQQTYNYNAACFPKPNALKVIDALIVLANSKREKGKYIIGKKTDWYMAWKVLSYLKIYTGNEYDFIDVVNECVLPNIIDIERRKSLEVSDTNFKNIKGGMNGSPMKRFPVNCWRRELENEKEKHPGMHGTLVLDRGVNIMVKLQELLKERGVEAHYYEKT